LIKTGVGALFVKYVFCGRRRKCAKFHDFFGANKEQRKLSNQFGGFSFALDAKAGHVVLESHAKGKCFMKKIIFALLTCFAAGQLLAADAPWLTSVPQATAQAKKENKLVLLDFTGSDWCGWCKKLDAETFSQPEFADYAKKNLVLVTVDFPSQKPQSAELKAANQALADKYHVNGYPTLIVLKPDGTVVWNQVGYLAGGPSAMIANLDDAKKK
jgi:thioredoxin-related protein